MEVGDGGDCFAHECGVVEVRVVAEHLVGVRVGTLRRRVGEVVPKIIERRGHRPSSWPNRVTTVVAACSVPPASFWSRT